MSRTQPNLDAPIPGQSLTTEPGSRPWENPPRLSTVTETAEFYLEQLSEPSKLANLLDKIEEGAPLTLLADTFQEIGVMKGIHTLDTGILVSPILIEFMKAMAEQEEIAYTIGIEEETDAGDEELANSIAKEVLTEEKPVDAMMKGDSVSIEEEVKPVASEGNKGLMSRRSIGDQQDGI